MPKNLSAMDRYRIIDECLKKGGSWNWESLAEEIYERLRLETGMKQPPGRRTIMLDIANMRNGRLGFNAPIEYSKAEESYFYKNRSFSIMNSPVPDKMVDELKKLKEIARSFRGFAGLKGIEEVVAFLDNLVEKQEPSHRKTPAVVLDSRHDYIGYEYMDRLIEAIRCGETLSISYESFEGETVTGRVFPYLLKQYNNRWFLFAYNADAEKIHNYPLDRIKDLAISIKPITDAPEFDQEAFFKDIYGVTRKEDETLTEIRIRVKKPRARYIDTKRLHPSQKVIEDQKNYMVFSITLIPNNEIISELLSYGSDLEVLSPARIRRRFHSILNDALKAYHKE